ncbi:methyltransferase domain-containing protein [Chitinophaga nivalis]|uniref:Methyltransferase domain-containing protein n=1 Tax=Chitinophaga nivalis TaxID=2991709 RepID=A0ABT3IHY0_9BACT|nr:methyltransferase domain-containing protein [Chitinophaga nivalis]MCW3466750.1 methyltransferase domain-containing protein [Chitinophaga nivalis]MCW3483559.1 methyltransferase domain-containing protein [Chitinophaga nivalis]
MWKDTKNRSTATEIMDDFQMEGTELYKTLEKIAMINRTLGGNKITLEGVAILLKQLPPAQPVTLVDAGCGNGDLLRELWRYGRQHNRQLQLIGIDANAFTVQHAAELSAAYPGIQYHCMDITDPAFATWQYDIILCTLTLHHFSNEAIAQLLRIFRERAAVGIVINDLHRSKVAYYLFQLMGYVVRLNPMSRQDGAVSILRGFKKKELIRFSQALNIVHYSLQWRWAFRYQWVISNV